MNNNVFTKIQGEAEKLEILDDLARARGTFMAKPTSLNKEIFTLMAEELTPEGLRCHLVKGNPPSGALLDLIVELFIGGEKYFGQFKTKRILETFYIQPEADLFRLQRRENFRLRFPKGFQASFEIRSLGKQAFTQKVVLVDLSGGGCRLEVPSTLAPTEKDEKISGILAMTGRDPLTVSGNIRHVIPTTTTAKVLLGIEFTGLTPQLKDKIAAQVMDLYRELFARMQ